MSNATYINYQDNLGYTALMYASQNGHIEIIKLLLENGADINIKNNEGKTALILALENNHLEIAELLGKFKMEYISQIIN